MMPSGEIQTLFLMRVQSQFMCQVTTPLHGGGVAWLYRGIIIHKVMKLLVYRDSISRMFQL